MRVKVYIRKRRSAGIFGYFDLPSKVGIRFGAALDFSCTKMFCAEQIGNHLDDRVQGRN